MTPCLILATAVWLVVVSLNGCGKKETPVGVDAGDARLVEMSDRAAGIRSWAAVCKGEASKRTCDQGDNTLWNGLLCSSGESWACDAVKAMQEPEGWVRRSGSRIGNTVELNPTSRDMTLGFALYAQARKDRAAVERLLAYWKSTGRLGPRCDDRCIASPLVLNALRVAGGIGTGQVADHVFVLENARGAPAGYPRHLAAVQILLRKRAGWGGPFLAEASALLVRREPQNAFFRYVAGDRDAALNLWLKYAPRTKPADTYQHSFERTDSDEAWRKSYGWEFIQLANLLSN